MKHQIAGGSSSISASKVNEMNDSLHRKSLETFPVLYAVVYEMGCETTWDASVFKTDCRTDNMN